MATEETTPKINIATKIKEHFKEYWRTYIFGAAASAIIVGVYAIGKIQQRTGHFEMTSQTATAPKIKDGFVDLKKLGQPLYWDLDFDGQLETIISYENQTLLLKASKTYDGKTKLEANPFEISEKK